MERIIVDAVNKVGVDINRAVTDSYYQHLLQFVSGLGPRKAQLLVKKIASMVCTKDIQLRCYSRNVLICVLGRQSHQSRAVH